MRRLSDYARQYQIAQTPTATLPAIRPMHTPLPEPVNSLLIDLAEQLHEEPIWVLWESLSMRYEVEMLTVHMEAVR
jgi:hypothetical protein